MSFEFLTVTVQQRIATLTVNRPDKLNALNAALIDELGQAIDVVRGDVDVGGIIVTGAQRAFVAGADIGELSTLTPVAAQALAVHGQDVFARFASSPSPSSPPSMDLPSAAAASWPWPAMCAWHPTAPGSDSPR